MSAKNEVTIKVTSFEQEQFKDAIIKAVKLISESSEGTGQNNYPIITNLLELYQKLN